MIDGKYHFGEFFMSYPILQKTSIVLTGLKEKSEIQEVYGAQLALRKQLAKKLYAIGGARYQWNRTSDLNERQIINVNGDQARKEVFWGLEYEVKSNWIIYSGYKRLLNQPKFAPQGFKYPRAKSSLVLGSRWQF